MKNTMLLVVCLLISATIFGQNEKISKIRISDLGIYNGINGDYSNYADINDFTKLAPGSEMLKNDFTDFTQSSSYFNMSSNDNVFTINLGLQFYNAEKQDYNANPKLNLGVTFRSGSTLNAYYSKSENIRFDTLSSPNSDYTIFMDSVSSQSYQMNYMFEQIGINANLVFRTQPQARWSLYGGIGISAMTSLRAESILSYYSSMSVNYVFPNSSYYHSYSSYNEENYESYDEIHVNKTNISTFAYIPLGIDFRIARKNEFWNKMHLIMELQPGIAIDYIPELGTKTYGIYKGNFGVRVEI